MKLCHLGDEVAYLGNKALGAVELSANFQLRAITQPHYALLSASIS